MSKRYPYFSDKEKKKNILCNRCHERKDGYKLEWQVSWFRGDDEYEEICIDCERKRETEEKIQAKHQAIRWAKRAQKQEDFWDSMKQRLEAKYHVRYLTQYQWRINDVVDIYPTNRLYHDLVKNERGSYEDMHKFLTKHFKPQKQFDPV